MAESLQRPREHRYELDVIRAVTALAVVGVHVTAFTLVLAQTQTAQLVQNGVVSALHFTREIFIAITAFVMVYIYGGRRFSARTFWRKRGIGVLLPYVAWSVFYDWQTKPALPLVPRVLRIVGEILVGGASFQLYYILLTLELYLVLPWFLSFMAWAGRYPWRLLGGSFALQVVLLALDYHFVQSGSLPTTGAGQVLLSAQDRFLPLYQFYMVFGGLAALYRSNVQAFLARYGRWTIAGLGAGFALLWGNLLYQTMVTHRGMGYGIAVFQPVMAVYGLAVAAFLYWISLRWAQARAPQPPRWHRLWGQLSDASFGIYLMHAFLMDLALAYLVPRLPGHGPEALQVALVWALVAGGTAALCVAWLYVPGLSRLIGRPCALDSEGAIGRRLAAGEALARGWLGAASSVVRNAGMPGVTPLFARPAPPTRPLASAKAHPGADS